MCKASSVGKGKGERGGRERERGGRRYAHIRCEKCEIYYTCDTCDTYEDRLQMRVCGAINTRLIGGKGFSAMSGEEKIQTTSCTLDGAQRNMQSRTRIYLHKRDRNRIPDPRVKGVGVPTEGWSTPVIPLE